MPNDPAQPSVVPFSSPHHQHWQLDKRVPVATLLALIITVLTQLIVGIWWIARLESRVIIIELAQTKYERKMDIMVDELRRLNENLIRVQIRQERQN